MEGEHVERLEAVALGARPGEQPACLVGGEGEHLGLCGAGDLLAGAKRCIYERGYGRTTARDIVEASGTNLASIGYRFGAKEALLDAAMMESLGDWGAELERILAEADDEGAGPLERLEGVWARVTGSFEEHRPALVASFKAFARAEHSPELRAPIAAGQEEARSWLAALFAGGKVGPDGGPRGPSAPFTWRSSTG